MANQTLRFHTVEQLGEKRSFTPEGFLVCQDVPVGRTGTMIYGPNETPVSPGSDGLVRIMRDEEEIFNPTYLSSLEGKAVTDNHPEEDVVPANIRKHFRGTMMNVRRGSGLLSDCIVADLMVMDSAAIKSVLDGKVEVSLGYDADYEELQPGLGRQLNLVGNHVALVEAGRCGSRCSIGDSKPKDPLTGVKNMSKKTTFLSKLLAQFKVSDSAELIEKLENIEVDDDGAEVNGSTTININTGRTNDADPTNDAALKEMGERVNKLEEGQKTTHDMLTKIQDTLTAGNGSTATIDAATEAELEAEAPAGKGTLARKATDSAYLEDSFQETISAAEILAPGIRVPTYDGAAAPSKTLDNICKLRRSALDLAYHTADGRAIIEDVNGGKGLDDLANMSCSAVRTLFRSAVAAKRVANKITAKDTRGPGYDNVAKGGKIRSLADLNKANEDLYKVEEVKA